MNFDNFKAALIGDWRGTKQLYLEPPPIPPVSSPSKLSITQVAGDSFLQFNYDWKYESEAPTGLLLLGYSGEQNAVSAAWIDSFI